jgi:hypothetical protein
MAATPKRIEVRSPDGSLLLSLRLFDEPPQKGSQTRAQSPAPANRVSRPASAPRNQPADGNGEHDADAITDAQKRYLFRILAEQGLQGDDALTHLKERLGVEVLNNVTKREASNLIEELLGSAAPA